MKSKQEYLRMLFGEPKSRIENEVLARVSQTAPALNPIKIINYIEMPRADTYALGVHALREACEQENNQAHPKHNGIYRPLTFKETIEARVNDYESNTDKLRLFKNWKDTCTGIAYKKGTLKFKIIPVCNELINIDKNYKDSSIPINYDSIKAQELDFKKIKNDTRLTKKEVLEHPAWLEAVEGDKTLLKTYADIVFKELKQNEAMGFYKKDNPNNELRRLYLGSLGNDSLAIGNDGLDDDARFLRGSPV